MKTTEKQKVSIPLRELRFFYPYKEAVAEVLLKLLKFQFPYGN